MPASGRAAAGEKGGERGGGAEAAARGRRDVAEMRPRCGRGWIGCSTARRRQARVGGPTAISGHLGSSRVISGHLGSSAGAASASRRRTTTTLTRTSSRSWSSRSARCAASSGSSPRESRPCHGQRRFGERPLCSRGSSESL
ncbi:hypothetical protein EMIHUDRAFT_441653, partial [Emiliania huxleyi CCMP1516]|uniref:Uncharacterized protein n=2 Tax=Emiliania huxleyi TaxID=2903 RepID=A0A0D3KC85_EMIH1